MLPCVVCSFSHLHPACLSRRQVRCHSTKYVRGKHLELECRKTQQFLTKKIIKLTQLWQESTSIPFISSFDERFSSSVSSNNAKFEILLGLTAVLVTFDKDAEECDPSEVRYIESG